MHYETTGKLTKFESAAGDVWTLVGFGGDRVYAVIDPFNRRTSIVYGGSDKIQRVVDAYGRITTFTVDGSGDLVKMTTPELCETEFRYDANHQLTAYIDPEGAAPRFRTKASTIGSSRSRRPTARGSPTSGTSGARRGSSTLRATRPG